MLEDDENKQFRKISSRLTPRQRTQVTEFNILDQSEDNDYLKKIDEMEKQNLSYINDIKELENLKAEDRKKYHDLEIECADNMDRINQLVSDNQTYENINNEKKR